MKKKKILFCFRFFLVEFVKFDIVSIEFRFDNIFLRVCDAVEFILLFGWPKKYFTGEFN